jgi:hypothetical protein
VTWLAIASLWCGVAFVLSRQMHERSNMIGWMFAILLWPVGLLTLGGNGNGGEE